MWTILPHLTACLAGEALVLLDIRRDRYFRVPASITEATLEWLDGSAPAAPAALISVLVRNRVASELDFDGLVATARKVEIPGALEDPMGRGGELPAVPGLTRCLLGTLVALRVQPLSTMIERRRDARLDHEDVVRPISSDLLAAYHRKRRIVPIRKNCLLDSFALDRWLGRLGPPRNIVFGVTAEPFLAHCWLQSDAAVLNDSHDHVRRYSPILVV